jgi:hypothetical protein
LDEGFIQSQSTYPPRRLHATHMPHLAGGTLRECAVYTPVVASRIANLKRMSLDASAGVPQPPRLGHVLILQRAFHAGPRARWLRTTTTSSFSTSCCEGPAQAVSLRKNKRSSAQWRRCSAAPLAFVTSCD